MIVFKCKMCGGELDFAEGSTIAICKFCGRKQTLPKLNDEKIARLYDRAGHFRRNNEFDKAAAIYEDILNENTEDAEAYWSLVLCKYGIEYVVDPATQNRIPTVNRAQFTSVFDDDNYRSALKYADIGQKAIYEAEAKAINEIQRGILAISQKEEPFDIFICYKESDEFGSRTRDSVVAQEIYYQLTNEGYKVFFSRITLEDKLGVAYEPYIFAALNSAKIMIVVGSKQEYFNAVWVKNEWSRYLFLVKQSDGKKMLIPAYKDMDPYDLPNEFSHLQAQDMSKLGFMQDLIRGIRKIIGENKHISEAEDESLLYTPEATTVPQPTKPVSPTISNLLKRAYNFLEDNDFQSADQYCNRVLDLDPENAEAYLVKLLADLKISNQGALRYLSYSYDIVDNKNYKKILKYGNEKLCDTLKQYIEEIDKSNNKEFITNELECANKRLQEKNWDKVKSSADLILCRDKENVQAYFLKLLADLQCVDIEELKAISFPFDDNANYQKIISLNDKKTTTMLQPLIMKFQNMYSNREIRKLKLSYDDDDRYVEIAPIKLDKATIKSMFMNYGGISDYITPTEGLLYRDGFATFMEKVEIAESITEIPDYGFSSSKAIKTLIIPESVIRIGDSAFDQCQDLQSINIPNGVVEIGENAFSSCYNIKMLTLPEGIKEIKDNTFSDCHKLTDINIPKGVVAIGAFAFNECKSLKQIEIPEGVQTIGEYAFCGCEQLEYISIPNSVTSIGDSAFYGCESLKQIEIPGGVQAIGEYAFSGCCELQSVSIFGKITTIQKGTFCDCTSLVDVSLPDTVEIIAENAFSGCEALVSIVLPNSMKTICNRAFYQCEALKTIKIDVKLKEIEDGAFESCNELMEIPKTKGPCYVATAVYGSYDCPQVWTLRRYRDHTLAKTWYGRAFIHFYYAVSPKLVKWFGKTNWFKRICQSKLDQMIKKLNDCGVENTPYDDYEWQ